MAIFKKKNEDARAEARLLLESDDPVELPPAEIDETAVIVNFDSYRPHVPELLEALRAGTEAEPVPVMLDGSTFVVHGATRSFWVKLWHSSEELTRVVRAQVVSCLPSTRGVQVYVAGLEDEEDYDDEEFDEDDFEEDDEDDDEEDGAARASSDEGHSEGDYDNDEEPDADLDDDGGRRRR